MKYLSFLEKYKDLVPGEIVPCPLEEIAFFEKQHQLILPLAYKEFLLIMGKKSGDLFSGSDVEFSILAELQLEANEILERSIGKKLNPDEFVIFIHLNYSILFFSLLAGDDPPVYLFIEPEESPNIRMEYKSFSDYIFFQLDNCLKLDRYLKKTGPLPSAWGNKFIIER